MFRNHTTVTGLELETAWKNFFNKAGFSAYTANQAIELAASTLGVSTPEGYYVSGLEQLVDLVVRTRSGSWMAIQIKSSADQAAKHLQLAINKGWSIPPVLVGSPPRFAGTEEMILWDLASAGTFPMPSSMPGSAYGKSEAIRCANLAETRIDCRLLPDWLHYLARNGNAEAKTRFEKKVAAAAQSQQYASARCDRRNAQAVPA